MDVSNEDSSAMGMNELGIVDYAKKSGFEVHKSTTIKMARGVGYMGSTSSTPINRKDNVLQQTGYILIFGTRFEYGYEIREEMSLNLTRESQNAPLRFRNRIEARTESKQ
ncbi:hypothetical protein LXL04_016437 [Taraxacum kok-saghyz]